MPWTSIACFVGGVFLANFVPHFIAGVAGRRFPTPFATPPFRGLSSAVVNVLWGLANLGAAYGLLAHVASLQPKDAAHVGITAAGFGLASIGIARSTSRLPQPSS